MLAVAVSIVPILEVVGPNDAVSHSAQQYRHELGIRIVLGAQRNDTTECLSIKRS
jgi:hypothetical protein